MALETGTYISDLNASNPAAGDQKAQGDDHLRLLKSTIKTTFPNVAGAVTPSHTVLNYMLGVTSAVQTQLDAKLNLTGGTISGNLAVTGTLGVTGAFSGTTGAFSGAVTGVTASVGDSSTKFATTAYVQTTAFNSALPDQTGNSGKFPLTNGSTVSWAYVSLAANVTGTLPVANGGTGAATLTGLVKGNGTSAMTAAVAGTDYQAVLVSGTNIKTINGASVLGSGDITAGAAQVLHVRDEKASGTNGGGSTSGSWQVRTLNTVVLNEISGASLASNTITLPAGTYEVFARAPSVGSDQHKIKIRNTSDSTDTLIGSNSSSTGAASTDSLVRGKFTIAGSKDFQLQHFFNTSSAVVGLGSNVSASVVEVFGEVFIKKVA